MTLNQGAWAKHLWESARRTPPLEVLFGDGAPPAEMYSGKKSGGLRGQPFNSDSDTPSHGPALFCDVLSGIAASSLACDQWRSLPCRSSFAYRKASVSAPIISEVHLCAKTICSSPVLQYDYGF